MKKDNNYILPTIGPETEDNVSLARILKYSNVLRLNGSHNTLDWHNGIINKIKKINPECTILFDIPGVKPRTLNKNNISIKKNENIIFIDSTYTNKKQNSIPLSNLIPKIIKSTNFFSVADGQYSFKYIKSGKGFIIGKSLSTFILLPKKGLNIPNSVYDDELQFQVYKNFIRKSKYIGYDAVGVSFIQSGKMLKSLKDLFPEMIMVSKVENSEGLKNLDEICLNSDAVMIDRGDLAAEIGDIYLYSAVNNIASEAKKNGKPLIIATENLESMQTRPSPTKSEIMSIGHSLSLSADKIMLSEETAISKNWLQTIKWLDKFFITKVTVPRGVNKSIINDLDSNLIWKILDNSRDLPIVVFTRSGAAIEKAKSINPSIRIISFTDMKKTLKLSKFWSDVSCYYLKNFDNSKGNNFVFNIIKKFKKEIFKNNNDAIVLYISDPKPGSRANTVTVIRKKDFF